MGRNSRQKDGARGIASFSARNVADMCDQATTDELQDLVDAVEDEPGSHRALLIELGDLRDHAAPTPISHELDAYRRWEKIVSRLERLPVALLASIDGACDADCLGLALACDMRIATERSSVSFPEVRQGVLPGMELFRLPKYVGLGVAKRMILRSEPIEAKEALGLGLFDHLCSEEEIVDVRRTALEELGALDGRVLRLARRLLGESYAASYDDAIGHYLAAQSHCLTRLREGT